MRMMLLSLAGAVSALAVTSPAAAQWAPQPSPYGYGGQAYGYGYNNYGYNNYGASGLQARIANIRRQIFVLSRQQRLSPGQSQHLLREAQQLDSRAREESYEADGRELRQVAERVERLEQRVRYAASYGNRYGYGGYNNAYGYNGYGAYNGYQGRGDRDYGDDDGD